MVPVGEDQIPHIELARETARRFNNRYGELFVKPSSYTSDVSRLLGTDGSNKMSKSRGNVIQLKDSGGQVENGVENMYTDEKKIHKDDPGRPEQCPVHLYEKAFSSALMERIQERAEACRNGELGCVEHKEILKKELNKFLDPIRKRRKKAKERDLAQILKRGSDFARKVVKGNIKKAEEMMHLSYPTIFNS